MWRGLILFWGIFVIVLAGGFVALQWLGPPGAVTRLSSETPVHGEPPHPPPEHLVTLPIAAAVVAVPAAAFVPRQPGRTVPGPIPGPEAALLEPIRKPADGGLPRIAADGRIPSQAYAGAFKPVAGRQQIAIVVASFGLNAAMDAETIKALPAGISFGVSPYAPLSPVALQAAREAGHELLLSIPMEPQGFPLNDPGAHALLSTATPDENKENLRWVLGRVSGYAGVTAALGPGLNGERFAQLTEQMEAMLGELAARGVFYLDPRVASADAAALPFVWSRGTDRVIDDPPGRAGIDAKLAEMETIASDRGVAVGLVGVATPVVLDRLKAWSRGLAERGYDLAPASAVMLAPSPLLVVGKITPAAHH